MKVGIKNFKALFVVILSMVNIGDKMGHKNNWGERMSLMFGILPMFMSLGGIEWGQVFPEAQDIDTEERQELVDLTLSTLDLEDDALEDTVEKAIVMTNRVFGMVNEIIDFVKSIRSIFKK